MIMETDVQVPLNVFMIRKRMEPLVLVAVLVHAGSARVSENFTYFQSLKKIKLYASHIHLEVNLWPLHTDYLGLSITTFDNDMPPLLKKYSYYF